MSRGLFRIIGPGILVAATGVGAGDLATAAFTGAHLGVAVLWAVLVGAGLKFVLNEGLARWQLATGETFLEGCATRFGNVVLFAFVLYLVLWSFFVGGALVSACGVASHAMLPLIDAKTDKIIYGVGHSFVAVLLVLRGGYRLFEKLMSGCIAVMFVTVVATAVAVGPQWSDVARGLIVPTIPDFRGQGLAWTVALMGGVGGTVTVLCYGYWIREEGRLGPNDLKTCRIDLATGYAMTALFGLAMVILGSRIQVEQGKGAELIVRLAERLQSSLGTFGTFGKWAFLVGAWGAIASSLLGVWQSVPYLFADCVNIWKSDNRTMRDAVDTTSPAYRGYLYAIGTVPLVGLFISFEHVQKWYAIVGAAFMPMLALGLLILNGRSKFVSSRFRNSWLTTVLLVSTLVFFAALAGFGISPG